MRSLNINIDNEIIFYTNGRNNIDKFMIVSYDDHCCMVFISQPQPTPDNPFCGSTHRHLLPAYIAPVHMYWYKHGKYHTIYGPAAIYTKGEPHYWLDNSPYRKEKWEVERLRYMEET